LLASRLAFAGSTIHYASRISYLKSHFQAQTAIGSPFIIGTGIKVILWREPSR
jgi:hypothetical protein